MPSFFVAIFSTSDIEGHEQRKNVVGMSLLESHIVMSDLGGTPVSLASRQT